MPSRWNGGDGRSRGTLLAVTWKAAVLTALCGLAGCGSGATGPELYTVAGQVLFDGAPIPEGRILFRKLDGDHRAFAGEISNGTYQVAAEPGKMTVEISASRLIPGKFDTSNGTPEPMGEMYIPRRYNAETILTAEVTPSDHNDIPFELKSK